MTETTEIARPRPRARLIGAVWLLYLVVGGLSMLLAKGIIVQGDAAATASNLLAHAALFRISASIDLLANCIYIALTALLYGLFRRVDRDLPVLAAFFSLVGCTVQIVGGLLRLAPPIVLMDPRLSGAFNVQQVQAAALFNIAMYTAVFQISFVLFAFFDITLGVLILKSRFLPKFFGWVFIVGGAGWLAYTWLPALASVRMVVFAIGGAAELLLMLWLMAKGVDERYWPGPA